jgi:hypothetical protein
MTRGPCGNETSRRDTAGKGNGSVHRHARAGRGRLATPMHENVERTSHRADAALNERPGHLRIPVPIRGVEAFPAKSQQRAAHKRH